MKEKNKKLKEIILYIYDVSKVCGWWWVIVVLYDVCVMMHEAKEGCSQAEQLCGIAVDLACQLLKSERSSLSYDLCHGGDVESTVVGFNKHALRRCDEQRLGVEAMSEREI